MDQYNLSQLGQRVDIPASPEQAQIECVPAPESPEPAPARIQYIVRFSIPEFTSLCPVTGSPDFARIVIDYLPDKLLIESKSLKLFAGSFRNHACFHEQAINMIGDRLFQAAQCSWMRICAWFTPRGGIPIDVYWTQGRWPSGIFVPKVDMSTYRMR